MGHAHGRLAARAVDQAGGADENRRVGRIGGQMRLQRFDGLARGEAGRHDVLDHEDTGARCDLEAAPQLELAVLALDEDRLGAEMPGGLVAGHDAADGGRDDDIDLAEGRLDLLGQRAA